MAEQRTGKTTLTTVEAHSTAPVVSYPKGRSDDEAMVEMIKADLEFAKAYLVVAL